MTTSFFHRTEWHPRTLPASVPVKDQLRAHLQDRSECATFQDDLASVGKSRPVTDLNQAVRNAVFIQEGADGHFRESLKDAGDW